MIHKFVQDVVVYGYVQSNFSLAATLGTREKWPHVRVGRSTQVPALLVARVKGNAIGVPTFSRLLDKCIKVFTVHKKAIIVGCRLWTAILISHWLIYL